MLVILKLLIQLTAPSPLRYCMFTRVCRTFTLYDFGLICVNNLCKLFYKFKLNNYFTILALLIPARIGFIDCKACYSCNVITYGIDLYEDTPFDL